MLTSTQRATRPTKPAAAKLPYPKLPDNFDDKAFWLAVYLRDQAELAQLQQLTQTKEFLRKNRAFQHAIHGAINHQRDDIKLTLGYTLQNGMLPFAHAHTTYFDQQVAA